MDIQEITDTVDIVEGLESTTVYSYAMENGGKKYA